MLRLALLCAAAATALRTGIPSRALRPSLLGSARLAAPLCAAERCWRLFGVEVAPGDRSELGLDVTDSLRDAVSERLGCAVDPEDVTLVRKSLDCRRRQSRGRVVCWTYVVDVTVPSSVAKRLKTQPGRQVPASSEQEGSHSIAPAAPRWAGPAPSVIVVGAGPCGLFAALTLATAGVHVTIVERGKPVEQRGRDIGALSARSVLNPESNYCYGEGGAGTWSDGKLTTRIGRNSAAVRHVLRTLVRFGAPERILLDGKPHLGTDNLVKLLKGFRAELQRLGAAFRWESRVERLLVDDGDGSAAPADGHLLSSSRIVRGVQLIGGEQLQADAVVLAMGHSARELYAHLHDVGATMAPKDFAVGFRVEHPQTTIDAAQAMNA